MTNCFTVQTSNILVIDKNCNRIPSVLCLLFSPVIAQKYSRGISNGDTIKTSISKGLHHNSLFRNGTCYETGIYFLFQHGIQDKHCNLQRHTGSFCIRLTNLVVFETCSYTALKIQIEVYLLKSSIFTCLVTFLFSFSLSSLSFFLVHLMPRT